MRPKGIKPIEQHIEKIVLGVVAAIFLVVLITQLTSQPLTVQAAGTEDQPADALEGPVADMARRAREQMNRPGSELADGEQGLPAIEDQRFALADQWRSMLSDRAGRPARLAGIVDAEGPEGAASAGEGGATFEGGAGEVLYPEIEVPAPTGVLAASHRGTLSPFVVRDSERLASMVPESQPFDKASATVEAVFNGQALAERLRRDPAPDDGGYAAVPRDWWEDNMALFGVEVQRCEGFDDEGNPVNPTTLSRPPGRDSPLEPLESDSLPGASAYQRRIDQAMSVAEQITRPRYYPVIAGPEWRSPSDQRTLAEIEANRDQIERLRERREAVTENISDLEQELGAVGSEGGGNERAVERRREGLQNEIEAARDRRDQFEQELESLGVNTEGEPLLLVEEEAEDRRRSRRQRAENPLETERLRLWSHDLTVEPGERYRYRIRVVMSNPFFGYASQLKPEQAELARQPALTGAWSDWSEPIEVTPDQTFFITSASQGGPTGGEPRATAEAFRFYYGYWRKTSVSLLPGETIAGEIELPDPDLLPIFDLAAMEDAGGGGGTTGGDRRPASERDGDVELPEGAEPGPETIPVRIDAMLLDVAEMVSAAQVQGGSRFQAYLQNADGRIRIRRPAAEGRSPLYERLNESAREGERQGRPEPEPEEPQRRRPEPEEERSPQTPQTPGTGGGG